MNIYFLVEGKTELKVYPQWLNHLAPTLSRVNFAQDASINNYYLISGLGYPRLLDIELVNSVEEINECANYDYLVLVIDSDDMTEQEKIDEIYQFINDNNIMLNSSCQLQVIAQKSCMETWFLGNKRVYKNSVGNHSDFYQHAKFYDVSQQDPELMGKPKDFAGSVSIYHEIYLRKMLAERTIRYSKSTPKEVDEPYYLDELQKRVADTQHLTSLKNFFNFCETISML
ncbi:MAG: hypothetical protein ACXWT0_14790 [Methylobacter sp.]